MKILALAQRSSKRECDLLDSFEEAQISIGTPQNLADVVTSRSLNDFAEQFDAVVIITTNRKEAVRAMRSFLLPETK